MRATAAIVRRAQRNAEKQPVCPLCRRMNGRLYCTTGPGDERVSLTFADFLRILGRQGAQISLLNNDDDDEDASDDDDDDDRMGSYDVPRFVPPFSPHDEPQEVGTELLKGGEFGSVAVKIRDRRNDRNISRSLRTRLDRPGAFHRRENITSVREIS